MNIHWGRVINLKDTMCNKCDGEIARGEYIYTVNEVDGICASCSYEEKINTPLN